MHIRQRVILLTNVLVQSVVICTYLTIEYVGAVWLPRDRGGPLEISTTNLFY